MRFPSQPYKPKEPNYNKTVIIGKKEIYFGCDIVVSEIPKDTETITLDTYSSENPDSVVLVFNKKVELEEHEKEPLRKEYEKMIPIYEKNLLIYKEQKELYDKHIKEQRDKLDYETYLNLKKRFE